MIVMLWKLCNYGQSVEFGKKLRWSLTEIRNGVDTNWECIEELNERVKNTLIGERLSEWESEWFAKAEIERTIIRKRGNSMKQSIRVVRSPWFQERREVIRKGIWEERSCSTEQETVNTGENYSHPKRGSVREKVDSQGSVWEGNYWLGSELP
jgi:hypothetical protein